jgi:exopolysaccharide production protein ExoY
MIPVGSTSVDALSVDRPYAADEGLFWRLVNVLERIAAGTLLLAILPLLSIAAIVVVLLSGRSPLIAHRRVGQGGCPMWVYKLRTMWDGKGQPRVCLIERISKETLPVHKKERDSRVTSRFAAFCRRYSIDELPQLYHVARGEMCLIGPRPLTKPELDFYYGRTAAELLTRKPGISGLWQVNGRSRLTYNQRRRLDLFLVRKWSPGLYFRTLLATIPTVLTGRNAW